MRKTLVSMTTLTTAVLLTVVLTACGVGGPGDDNDDAAVQDAQTQNDSTVNQDGTAGQDAQQDGQVTGVQTMTTEEFYNDHLDTWFDRGGHVVDMRADTDWAAAHIPDAVNLPLDLAWDNGAFTNYGSSTLSALVRVQDLPLAFYGLAADEATIMEVAQAALDMGYNNVWVIQGGIEAWRAAHHYEDIEMGVLYSDHYDPIPAGEFLIDADHADDYETKHIAGALLLDADAVWDHNAGTLIDNGQALIDLTNCDQTPPSTVIFYCVNHACGASVVLSKAAERISCFDNTQILHFAGGVEAWEGAGYPIACGSDPNGACQ